MRQSIQVLALLLSTIGAPAAPAQTAPQAPAAERDIVVTGEPLSKLRKELEECLARNCPPKEDINRSIAYAEGQFIAGDYPNSRKTLLAARARNARFAATLPVEVAALQRANARLAGLTGLSTQERIGTFDMVDALKAGLDGADARVLLARLEVGDLFARQGRLDDALERYRLVLAQSRKANLPYVEALALFHKAVLLSAVADTAASYKQPAREAITNVEHLTDPAFAPLRNGVRLIALRLLPPGKQAAVADAVVAKLEPVDSKHPFLAYSPQVDPDAMTAAGNGATTTEWADVAFTVTSDGVVTDIRTVRRSDHLPDYWLTTALKSLQGRRYVPSKTKSADGFQCVERYSFVNDIVTETGSRLAVRSSKVRLSIIDMTVYPDEKTEGVS